MRNFLVRMILRFAGFITSRMSLDRRSDVYWRVAKQLFPLNVLDIDTSRGKLLLDAGCRDFVQRAGTPTGVEHNEPDTYDWVNSMPQNACFWDIGANVGIYGLLASFDPTIKFFGFEPASRNFAVLNRNIELNKVSDRFTAYCMAFAEFTTLDYLNMKDTGVGSSMHGFGIEEDQFERTIKTNFRQGSIGFSMDDYIRLFSPPHPTHIKLDVDGLEPEILRGGRNTLSSHSVKSVIVEVEEKPGASRGREIHDLMADYGFVAQAKSDPKHRNVIFNRQELGDN